MKAKQSSRREILVKNLVTYFNAIFLLITVLLILAGSYRSLTFLPFVIANILIGIGQQLHAQKILDELTLISEAKYQVVRSGEALELTMEELQRDDLISLESGQQIPADADITEGKIAVNEALLTGESDEVEKAAGSALMSGSFVVSGHCRARLTAVGEASYISQLTEKAKEMKEKPSEIVSDIDLIVKVAGFSIIPIGCVLMWQGMVINQQGFSASVVSMVGAVIGMIPEGLYLLVTVSLALSAARLAKKQVLLHDMRSTEALARVDVLCVDKTGTITTNEMFVSEVFAPAEAAAEEADALLSSYIATTEDSNATSQALRAYYPGGKKWESAQVQPFSSRQKYSQIDWEGSRYRLGAPELLLSRENFEENRALIESRAAKGERVLAFARETEDGFRAIRFVSLANGIRAGAKETFQRLAQQEVKVLVISGDNPLTVSEIAKAVEIPGAEHYVDAGTLETPEDFEHALDTCTVFGRVKPEQKKLLVELLRKKGKKVAMTGDGVNDILAMKEADCSIAMGAGCDAARQAAQVVLLDSDFSHMQDIISEGRRDINNLTRSATLFLYKNIFSMLLALFSILNEFSYPLQPSQVSLISMFNIGIPAFLLALEPSDQKQHGRFLKITLVKSLPAALTSFFSIAALVMFGKVFSISDTDVGIAGTVLLSLVGFMILAKLCRPFGAYHKFVFFVCLAGFLICFFGFSSWFAIDHVSYQCVMLAMLFAIAEESLMRNLTRLFERKEI